MGETKESLIEGGSFLIEDISAQDILTPEDFTEEHKMIAQTTEEFVVGDVLPNLDEIENHQFKHSVTLMKKAGGLGLLSTDIPEKYGGLGLDAISSALITEKFSKAGSFSLTYGAHVGIGTLPIVFFGNDQQKEKYLPKLASGERIAAYALTEPSSGSDALGAKTTAKLNETSTHYILNGEKQWITNASFADIFIVYAKIDGKHFSAFIVERDFPGVSTGSEEKKMGIKGSSTRTLILEDAQVPVENLLGEKGRGHIIAFNILNVGRYKLAIGSVGGAKRALQLATKYVKERKQFQTRIADFSLTKEKLGTMASHIYANESAVYRTVGLLEQRMAKLPNKPNGLEIARSIAEYQMECSLNKFTSTELLDYVADEAVQLHGGYGFMQEYEVERIYRDSRINRIFEGTNEINRLLVPGTLLKKAMKGEIPLFEKAQQLQEELMMMIPEEVGEEKLEQEKYLLKNAKKIALLSVGLAAQKYEKDLEQEQEILVRLANIIGEIYHMESATLRTEKAIHTNGINNIKQKLLYTEVYIQEAFNRIERYAKEILVAVEQGDNLRMMLSALRKLTRHQPKNIMRIKREIAEMITEEEKYIV